MKAKTFIAGYRNVSKAPVGKLVTLPLDPPETEEVKPACDDKHSGYWYCITHSIALRDPEQHIGQDNDQSHELAWMCFLHGLETP